MTLEILELILCLLITIEWAGIILCLTWAMEVEYDESADATHRERT